MSTSLWKKRLRERLGDEQAHEPRDRDRGPWIVLDTRFHVLLDGSQSALRRRSGFRERIAGAPDGAHHLILRGRRLALDQLTHRLGQFCDLVLESVDLGVGGL